MKVKIQDVIKWLFVLGAFWSVVFLSIFNYWYYRPNTSYLNPALAMETWDVVADGEHNSNTDMIEWNNEFWMIHASSPFHLGTSESKLVIWNSTDAKTWNKVTELDFETAEDIRDPKFVNITGMLFIYALANAGAIAKPYKTVYCNSSDGVTWSAWKDLKGDASEGWLFWRPKTNDDTNWYVPAYWWDHGISLLLNSTDGITWTNISEIYRGETNDETAIEFYPNGTMICTARLEGVTDITLIGDATGSTLISVANAPYTTWTHIKSILTRLDGPYLFEYNNRVYAVGRYEPDFRGGFTNIGSFFGRKRTSLFIVEPTRLVYLSDLPSAGDTAYAGVVMKAGFIYINYYTSDIKRDWPWIVGVISPSDIRMAKIQLSKLEAVASSPPTVAAPSWVKIDNLLFNGGIVGTILLILYVVKVWNKKEKPRK